jgi:modulator of FtsH protease HflC
MKKNPYTLITAGVLVVIFLLLLFTFQVRKTQVAVVTNFGKFEETKTEPGLYFRWPAPIQKVYKLENRMQSFEGKFSQLPTRDEKMLMVSLFVGWRIGDPQIFLQRFDQGNKEKAEESLENLVEGAKMTVIGKRDFLDLISPDASQLGFDKIEKDILEKVRAQAEADYGIEVTVLGIKRIGLPTTVTSYVFTRMIQERNVLISQFRGEGQALAAEIRAEANRKRSEILAEANGQARRIEGKADEEAAAAYSVFAQNEELAMLILEVNAFKEVMKGKTTLILGPDTPALGILQSGSRNRDNAK